MLPIVLNEIFISGSYQRFFLAGSKMAGATREAVTKDDLKKMTVPLPPLSLQRDFANFARKVEHLRDVVQSQISTLRTLYDSLAQDYFAI